MKKKSSCAYIRRPLTQPQKEQNLVTGRDMCGPGEDRVCGPAE